MDKVPLESFKEIIELHSRMHTLIREHWREYQVFTLQWWLLLAALVAPWLVWWRLVDRQRTTHILCYGLLLMLLIIAMDAFGIVFEAWVYPVKLFPNIPHLVPVDWSLLPVAHMLIYQYFPGWRQFLIAEGIAAALLAFVGEPVAEWLGLYQPLKWYHHWSFPIYWAKAVFAKWLIERLAQAR